MTRKKKIEHSQLLKKIERVKTERKYGLICLIIGTIFSLFFGNMWLNRNQEITKEELVSIEGTIENKLEMKWKKTVGNFMTIRLNEYPKINYRIGRFSAEKMNVNSLMNNVSIGDKIQIDILEKDFDKVELDKQRTLFVYGLRNINGEYLNINDYNSAKKKDRNSIAVYLLLGFSFWMFGYGIYLILMIKNKNEASS